MYHINTFVFVSTRGVLREGGYEALLPPPGSVRFLVSRGLSGIKQYIKNKQIVIDYIILLDYN